MLDLYIYKHDLAAHIVSVTAETNPFPDVTRAKLRECFDIASHTARMAKKDIAWQGLLPESGRQMLNFFEALKRALLGHVGR